MEQLKSRIRHVPDFPKAGILFYDVTTLLRDPEGFRLAIDSMSVPYRDRGIDLVVGVESRGIISCRGDIYIVPVVGEEAELVRCAGEDDSEDERVVILLRCI